MDTDRLAHLLDRQDGVVSRSQVLSCGFDDCFIERRLRRKDWARRERGVYVDHTGPLSWNQRAWVALLVTAPSALCQVSALVAEGLGSVAGHRADGPIHVAIDQSRRVTAPRGVVLHRVNDLPLAVQPARLPPRVRLERAVLDTASVAPDEAGAVAILADACQTGRTTPARLLGSLRTRPRLPARRFLARLLEDVATGSYSALEHAYLTRVERPHGLPGGQRQRRVTSGRRVGYRDVEYVGLRTVVELDGRLGHEWQRQRWADLERDVESLASGDVTVRLGWRQVLAPCRTAALVAKVLHGQGWLGASSRCGPDCAAAPGRRAAS